MTDTELRRILWSFVPHASADTIALNSDSPPSPQKKNKTSLRANLGAGKGIHEDNIERKIQHPKSERHKTPALGAAVQGKTKRLPCTIVRFVGYRTRPLDPDNFAGGCKDLLDGLRHARLIQGDDPTQIKFNTEQVKVKIRTEERTEIQIET